MTESRLQSCAADASHLHIATHGRFAEGTPAFHEILVEPGDGDDGSLYAWEIMEFDLSSNELVTLSACESALTVADRVGNLDGIPIAFLGAGASAVIGTLEPIETTASRHFFESLYSAIAEGSSRGDAFRIAQQDVRIAHPDPKRWAAFYLLGDWR